MLYTVAAITYTSDEVTQDDTEFTTTEDVSPSTLSDYDFLFDCASASGSDPLEGIQLNIPTDKVSLA